MSGIFISYRREDSAPYAGRIYDRLSAEFGADQVFMDVDDIAPGADFVAQIGAKVGGCDALIAVIGKNWLSARNAKGQLRFADPNDFVGLELSLALDRAWCGHARRSPGRVAPRRLRRRMEEVRAAVGCPHPRQARRRNAADARDDSWRIRPWLDGGVGSSTTK
jgi:hypothetical protein